MRKIFVTISLFKCILIRLYREGKGRDLSFAYSRVCNESLINSATNLILLDGANHLICRSKAGKFGELILKIHRDTFEDTPLSFVPSLSTTRENIRGKTRRFSYIEFFVIYDVIMTMK